MSEVLSVSDEVRGLIGQLVACDTTSCNSNLDLIHFVGDYLKGLGVTALLTFDDSKHKANFYATLGPTDRGGIALSGQSDLVPVEGQDWSRDPWTLTEREGRLRDRVSAR